MENFFFGGIIVSFAGCPFMAGTDGATTGRGGVLSGSCASVAPTYWDMSGLVVFQKWVSSTVIFPLVTSIPVA